jgi:hypothetical protein
MSCGCCGDAKESGGRVDYQYAVKVLCGFIPKITPEESELEALPAGQYFTKVNIHNFSRCDCTTFRWKVAIGFPQLHIGPVSDFADATLCADEAFEIDVSDIWKRLGGRIRGHAEGWVVIESPTELDVVAVYATTIAKGEPINTFHTERVHPRCLTVCEDFHLEASTGVAIWEVAGPFPGPAPANAVFTAATLGSIDNNWSPMSSSLWVHPPGANIQPEGDYTYRLRFKLCSGFRNAHVEGAMLADYYANAFLNGVQISVPQSGGPNYSTPIPFVGSNFKSGWNELRIVVHNSEKSTTGLAVRGVINVEAGLCPGEPMPTWSCPSLCYHVYAADFKFNPFIGMFMYSNGHLENPVCGGGQAGTTGSFRRIEELGMWLSGTIPPGTELMYQVFTCNLNGSTIGWSAPMSSGMAGTTGADHPITAVKMWLKNAPVHCHLRFSICGRSNLGFPLGGSSWSPDYYDGAVAGTTAVNALDRRIEAIKADIVWM